MSLEFQPLKGKVTGNAGMRFLVSALTGVGTIAAATVGVQGGLGVNNTISNNVLLRERLADNMALAGDRQLTELTYRQNIVVSLPGNTRFYIVLAKQGSDQTGPARSGPANNPATALPSVQEAPGIDGAEKRINADVSAATAKGGAPNQCSDRAAGVILALSPRWFRICKRIFSCFTRSAGWVKVDPRRVYAGLALPHRSEDSCGSRSAAFLS